MRGKNTDTPEIKFLEPFDRQLKNAPDEIQEAFFETLELFLADPQHPQLRNHELMKRFTGYRSIDVTGDWRAVFKDTQTGEQRVIKFYLLGTHPTPVPPRALRRNRTSLIFTQPLLNPYNILEYKN